MVRKWIGVLVSFVLIFGYGGVAFADGQADDELLTPRYVVISDILAGIDLSNGEATASLTVTASKAELVDRMVATLKVVNDRGTVIKTWKDVELRKNPYNDREYIGIVSCSLPSRGKYKMTYDLTCYKNKVQVERTKGGSPYKTY